MLMADAEVARTAEKVAVPSPEEIKLQERKRYEGPKDQYLPFDWGDDYVPPMADITGGYKFHVTGLTHDRRGYPVLDEAAQELNVHSLMRKIRLNAANIIETEKDRVQDAEIVVVAYGTTANAAAEAVKRARAAGIKAGLFKLVTVWPLPEKKLAEMARKVKAFVVPEINCGQIVLEVQRCAQGNANTIFVSRVGAESRDPGDILAAIKLGATAARKPAGIIDADGHK
jgi:2-oxoglutarate ferredoxin oxidoreductase subunit alpha